MRFLLAAALCALLAAPVFPALAQHDDYKYSVEASPPNDVALPGGREPSLGEYIVYAIHRGWFTGLGNPYPHELQKQAALPSVGDGAFQECVEPRTFRLRIPVEGEGAGDAGGVGVIREPPRRIQKVQYPVTKSQKVGVFRNAGPEGGGPLLHLPKDFVPGAGGVKTNRLPVRVRARPPGDHQILGGPEDEFLAPRPVTDQRVVNPQVAVIVHLRPKGHSHHLRRLRDLPPRGGNLGIAAFRRPSLSPRGGLEDYLLRPFHPLRVGGPGRIAPPQR